MAFIKNIMPCKKIALTACAILAASAAHAAEHTIKMLNRGSDGANMVFEPAYVRAAVGDTIKFVATDKSHNAVTIDGLWPDGVAKVKGKFNEEISFVVSAEGLYGIRCTPHHSMGMVALIVAGKPAVTDAHRAVRQPGIAARRMSEMLDRTSKEP
jgi:pseudoazurin